MLVWACLLVVVARVPAMAAWHLDAAPTVALVFAGALHNDLHLKRGTRAVSTWMESALDLVVPHFLWRTGSTSPQMLSWPDMPALDWSAEQVGLGGRIYAPHSSRADVET